ncbi:MAG: hypothetical protein Q7V05_16040 [Methanoregula sp.]|nr:hypothetical protein [Methanoregula sp.]
MEEKFIRCPTCEIGEQISGIINDGPNGEYQEIYYYSCGHKARNCVLPTLMPIGTPQIPSYTLESEEKVGRKNNPKYKIENKVKYNDLDNPNRPCHYIWYWDRKCGSTNVFQIIQYPSGEIKHVDCKTCDTNWDYRQKFGYNDLFILNLEGKTNIECLYCHAKFEQ